MVRVLATALLLGSLLGGCADTATAVDDEQVTGADIPSPPAESVAGIALARPLPGAVFSPGDTLTLVAWSEPDSGYSAVFEWSIDNGRHWYTINDTGHIQFDERTLVYSFVLPDSVTQRDWRDGAFVVSRFSTISEECLIQVFDYNDNDVADRMEGTFSIR